MPKKYGRTRNMSPALLKEILDQKLQELYDEFGLERGPDGLLRPKKEDDDAIPPSTTPRS